MASLHLPLLSSLLLPSLLLLPTTAAAFEPKCKVKIDGYEYTVNFAGTFQRRELEEQVQQTCRSIGAANLDHCRYRILSRCTPSIILKEIVGCADRNADVASGGNSETDAGTSAARTTTLPGEGRLDHGSSSSSPATATSPSTSRRRACEPEDIVNVTSPTLTASFRICVFPRDVGDLVSEMIRRDGIWEPLDSQLVDGILAAGALAGAAARGGDLGDLGHHRHDTFDTPYIVVDVGAHLGWYTLLAAAHGHRVAAFEPLRAQRQRLLESVALNGFEDRVKVFPFAASSERQLLPGGGRRTAEVWSSKANETATLLLESEPGTDEGGEEDKEGDGGDGGDGGDSLKFSTKVNTGGSFLLPAGWRDEKNSAATAATELVEAVEIARLDDVLAGGGGGGIDDDDNNDDDDDDDGINSRDNLLPTSTSSSVSSWMGEDPVLLMKMDVEGHLGHALAGAVDLLSRTLALKLEVTPGVESANGCNSNAILSYLHDRRFRYCSSFTKLGAGSGANSSSSNMSLSCFAHRIGDVKVGHETQERGAWSALEMLYVRLDDERDTSSGTGSSSSSSSSSSGGISGSALPPGVRVSFREEKFEQTIFP